jgi:hypothetical protein
VLPGFHGPETTKPALGRPFLKSAAHAAAELLPVYPKTKSLVKFIVFFLFCS